MLVSEVCSKLGNYTSSTPDDLGDSKLAIMVVSDNLPTDNCTWVIRINPLNATDSDCFDMDWSNADYFIHFMGTDKQKHNMKYCDPEWIITMLLRCLENGWDKFFDRAWEVFNTSQSLEKLQNLTVCFFRFWKFAPRCVTEDLALQVFESFWDRNDLNIGNVGIVMEQMLPIFSRLKYGND